MWEVLFRMRNDKKWMVTSVLLEVNFLQVHFFSTYKCIFYLQVQNFLIFFSIPIFWNQQSAKLGGLEWSTIVKKRDSGLRTPFCCHGFLGSPEKGEREWERDWEREREREREKANFVQAAGFADPTAGGKEWLFPPSTLPTIDVVSTTFYPHAKGSGGIRTLDNGLMRQPLCWPFSSTNIILGANFSGRTQTMMDDEASVLPLHHRYPQRFLCWCQQQWQSLTPWHLDDEASVLPLRYMCYATPSFWCQQQP